MNKIDIALIITAIILVAAAAVFFMTGDNNANNEPKIIGGQRDIHGCLGPAGYSWNETEEKCVREWLPTNDSERYQTPD